MDTLVFLGRTLGFSVAAGVNLYATIALIGLACPSVGQYEAARTLRDISGATVRTAALSDRKWSSRPSACWAENTARSELRCWTAIAPLLFLFFTSPGNFSTPRCTWAIARRTSP